MQSPRLLTALLVAALLAGCGGSGGDDKAGPAPSPTPEAEAAVEYEPISSAATGKVKARMSEAELRRVAKVEPVLERRSTDGKPGGCLYYRMADMPLANVWEFCFDKRGVTSLRTAYSPNQPDPPKDASQRRAALIARADEVCAVDYGKLGAITNDVSGALSAFGRKASPANRTAAGKAIGRFVRNLTGTEEKLSSFEPPPDAQEDLATYLETVRSQIDVLADARAAFVAGEMAEYNRLGKEFSSLGDEGKLQARAYGFSTCSASTFK